MEKNGKTFIKGLVIGATMTVPGVSGGSMAMVLGIYDRSRKWGFFAFRGDQLAFNYKS